MSFETQRAAKRPTPSLGTKDPKLYNGDTAEELDDFLYECERQFDAKGFQKEDNREGVPSADPTAYNEETMKKISNEADSWTHFKTLLREFPEGDKEEAYAESSQKLKNAKQQKTNTVNELYNLMYKLHIRLRTLCRESAMTFQQFFDYFRARLLLEYRTKLNELIPGPQTMNELLRQVRRYERTTEVNAPKDGHKGSEEGSWKTSRCSGNSDCCAHSRSTQYEFSFR